MQLNQPPKKLLALQKWFATMITQPILPSQQLPSQTPFGSEVSLEAEKHITPSKQLKAHQRIEIYHQQYWWRLIGCLQENFPTLIRLFGFDSFDQQLAIPYLADSPPSHWALSCLGATLPRWIAKNYKGRDLDFVKKMALLDRAAQASFSAPSVEPVDFSTLTEREILTKKLTLQPHIHLFELPGDLLSFRDALLAKDVDHWSSHPFPQLSCGNSFFVVHRNQRNQVQWQEISSGEHRFLTLIKKNLSIQDVCDRISKEGGRQYLQAQEEMAFWLREWVYLQWFVENK